MSRSFDDEALRAAYEPALRETSTTHGPDCPTETQLFAAVRGEGDEPERLRVLDHALKCPACRRDLALLHAVATGRNVEWYLLGECAACSVNPRLLDRFSENISI